jgi:hypothetical protein
MRDPLRRAAAASGLLLTLAVAFSLTTNSYGQRSKPALVCKRPVLAALKPEPELSYPCDDRLQDWDEKILKLPARGAAIKTLMTDLASFSDVAWWAADAVDLSVCDFAKQPGTLNQAERRDFFNDYLFWLFGNDRMRLVLVSDPCYQTQYGGSTAFLLYRDGRRVVVSQVLDGYFSRAENSVSVDFARLGAEDIVEISTGSGGLNPTLTNYYFAIDPRSKRATPKNLFKGEHGPTNEITSAMLFERVPAALEPLQVVRANALAKSFTIYSEEENGKIEDNGRKLTRQTLRWNGKLYR